MRNTALALAMAFLAGLSPAQAQYNWDASASACTEFDDIDCMAVEAFARGKDFTVFVHNFGPGFIVYLDVFWPTVQSELVSGAPVHVDPFGLNFTIGDVDEYTAGIEEAGITGSTEFRLRFQSPIHVQDAFLWFDAYALREQERDPECEEEPFDSDCAYYEIMGQMTADAVITQVTPEPASLALLATGLLGIGAAARRKRRDPRRGSS